MLPGNGSHDPDKGNWKGIEPIQFHKFFNRGSKTFSAKTDLMSALAEIQNKKKTPCNVFINK